MTEGRQSPAGVAPGLATQSGNPRPREAGPACGRLNADDLAAALASLGPDHDAVRQLVEAATLQARFSARSALLQREIDGSEHPFTATQAERRFLDELDWAARRPEHVYAELTARAAVRLVLRYRLPGVEDLWAAHMRDPNCEGVE